MEASGEWECVVTTGRGNTSRTVEIVVLENSASFCPEDKVVNNRGEFRSVIVRVINHHILYHTHHFFVNLSLGVPVNLWFISQMAKNSGRHHLSTVLFAAALPLPVCGGGD